ncbi:plasmid partitioning protein RepB C-terminal domain-containing protein [Reyranella soli]|nr:plasmid partitioning protein RepB C-terminal domain-containing protein [Reyranella soli]
MAPAPVAKAFADATISIPLDEITTLHPVTDTVRASRKYAQITASVREVGLIEPIAVSIDPRTPGRYMVVDGRLRLEALKELGERDAVCLLSSDDEAYTFNKRTNRLAIIQEHKMILRAIELGASEDRVAAALHVKIDHIRRKRRLLDGISPDAVAILEDKHVSINAFDALRKMVSERQIEVAQAMVVMNRFTVSYAKTLLAGTPDSQLIAGRRRRQKTNGVTDEQLSIMQRESATLDREFRVIEETYGLDHLDLVLAKGYLGRMLANVQVHNYLERHHKDILAELMQLTEQQATVA